MRIGDSPIIMVPEPSNRARARMASYYQHKAAIEPALSEDDIPQLLRSDRVVEARNNYQVVKLSGNYESAFAPATFKGLGKCIRRAVRELTRIDVVNLPEWLNIADLPSVCDELGLILHIGEQKYELIRGKRIIIVYRTSEMRAHALVTDDPTKLPEVLDEVQAVIEVSPPINPQNRKD